MTTSSPQPSDLTSADDIALADRMNAGRRAIMIELRKMIVGQEEVLKPLQFLSGGRSPSRGISGLPRSPFTPIKTVADLDEALARATARGRPVLLDFYADWCVSCQAMERTTFPDPAVQAELTNVVLLQADVTRVDAADQALMARFRIVGPPTLVFFGADGRERPGGRWVGFSPPSEFAAHLRTQLGGP